MKYFLILVISLSLLPAISSSNLLLDKTEFSLRGEALVEVTIFKIDVYIAKYYDSKKLDGLHLLELNYQIDVERKHSLEGWSAGFKPLDIKKYEKSIEWIYDKTQDMKKGDSFSIWVKGSEVRFYLNNKLLAQVVDKDISDIAFFPWIGKEPLDEDIKKRLLGFKK
jgi:hypothetical protein